MSVLWLVSGLWLLTGYGFAQQFHYVSIDVPCSACPGQIAAQTIANGINSEGDIVGAFTDAVGLQHGFLLREGRFTTIDFPGAVATNANGISSSGRIVGNYTAPFTPGVSDTAPTDSPIYCPASGSAACTKAFCTATVTFPPCWPLAIRARSRGALRGMATSTAACTISTS